MMDKSNFIPLNDILTRGEYSSSRVLYALLHPLVEQLMSKTCDDDSQDNGTLTIDSIYLSPSMNEVDVRSASTSESRNVSDWGAIILDVMKQINSNDKKLAKIANDCLTGEITTLSQLHLMLERRVSHAIYIILLIIIISGLALLAFSHLGF